MIEPLYQGKSAHDVLQGLLANPQTSAYDAVLANAKTYIKGDAEAGWRKALHDGWVEGTAFPAKEGSGAGSAAALPATAPSAAAWRSASRRILRSMTAGSPMSAGCRSCPSR